VEILCNEMNFQNFGHLFLTIRYFVKDFIQPTSVIFKNNLINNAKEVDWKEKLTLMGYVGGGLTSGLVLLAPPDRRESKSLAIEILVHRLMSSVLVFPFAFVYFAGAPLTVPLTLYYYQFTKSTKRTQN
jgi:hypothetical protein